MLMFLRKLKYTIYYYILGTLGILEDVFNRKNNKCGKHYNLTLLFITYKPD